MKTISQQIKWDFEANGILEIKDKKGNRIYWEDPEGVWYKREYDSKGKLIYYENSNGVWSKCKFDSQDNLIYYKNSYGKVIDNRGL